MQKKLAPRAACLGAKGANNNRRPPRPIVIALPDVHPPRRARPPYVGSPPAIIRLRPAV